jgi:hypothetical protein
MNNTTENNKLIAEFMGLTIITDEISFFDTNYKPLKKYHTDWNCLMEVVGKIQLLDIVHDNTRNYDNVFKEWQCTFSPSYKTHDFGYIVGKSKNSEIESVYNACVEFIKWYNKQK